MGHPNLGKSINLLHAFALRCKVICMGELHSALGHIRGIRRQVARSTEFRGYGPATLAGTGLLAVAAAALQAQLLPQPAGRTGAYLLLWIGTAVIGASAAGVGVYTRTRRMHSGLSQEMLRIAVEQFLPAVTAGALLTVVIARLVPAAMWMLPGLWQIVYALGVFASCRFLPRAMVAAGGWYLLTGLVCLALGDARALAPWTMGVAFGVGQLLIAGVLWTAGEGDDDGR